MKIENLIYAALRLLAGPAYADPKFHYWKMIKAFWAQKILRKNSHVPWPVHASSMIKAPKHIQRGTRCPGLAPFCYIDGRNGIEIGENTWIGPRVSLISMNHDLNDYTRYTESDPIIVGKNCWIATGAIITAGVRLGDHTVVAAGAVVTKSFPEGNVLIGGIPAKRLKKLPEYNKNEFAQSD